jgi:hypothetical protein
MLCLRSIPPFFVRCLSSVFFLIFFLLVPSSQDAAAEVLT